ncbi:MAG: hypothetical protein ACOCVU_00040 [Desulfohalobiaceae bacterium]
MMPTYRACPVRKCPVFPVTTMLVLSTAFCAPAQARQDKELEPALDHVFALSESGAGVRFDAVRRLQQLFQAVSLVPL